MSESRQPLIHLDKVTKVFLTDEIETHALESIDLDIYNGEYIAISGTVWLWEIDAPVDSRAARHAVRRAV